VADLHGAVALVNLHRERAHANVEPDAHTTPEQARLLAHPLAVRWVAPFRKLRPTTAFVELFHPGPFHGLALFQRAPHTLRLPAGLRSGINHGAFR
jgi:hypothetical protein